MNKKILLTALLSLFAGPALAQDLVYVKAGRMIDTVAIMSVGDGKLNTGSGVRESVPQGVRCKLGRAG